MKFQRLIQWGVEVMAFVSTLFFLKEGLGGFTKDFGSAITILFISIIALSPIAVWHWQCQRVRLASSLYVLTVTGAILFSLVAFGYYDAFFVHIDALSGVLLFFLPIYEIAAFFVVYAGVSYFEKKKIIK